MQLNTHSYDGKLDLARLPNLPIIHELSLCDKRSRGFKLLQSCKHINSQALHYLTTIVNDMGTTNNVDNSHSITSKSGRCSFSLIADDLICLCWEHRNNLAFILELEIQLIDMSTGFCPQGRTHRLFQAVIPFCNE